MEARRRYWSRTMEKALVFLERTLRAPLEESGECLVDLRAASREESCSIRFSERPFPEYGQRLFFLRENLAARLFAAAAQFNESGLMIRVEDAYRTYEMQRALSTAPGIIDRIAEITRWETGNEHPSAELIADRLKVLVAWYPKTAGHMSGAAVDISVLDMRSGLELDRGGSYLELSEITPMDSPFISDEARRNRMLISDVMNRYGFQPYPFEFWHYSSGDLLAETASLSARPAIYGPVQLKPGGGSFKPISDPQIPIITVSDLYGEY